MPDVLDPATADEVYLLGLEPRRRARWGRLVAGALDLWCATTGGRFELTGAGVVVVRRRYDGVAELRVPVAGAEDAAVLLDVVRDQLATLSPAEFRTAWGI
ncbi:hypothetical protein [Nocardioides litoris]|uniref:hypothetical protein n=1 Tax=Nocardioides litoris TaxID=1926648 RepID=UPI001124BA6A|nr:hypothetical protein [Nocardioides litoris]